MKYTENMLEGMTFEYVQDPKWSYRITNVNIEKRNCTLKGGGNSEYLISTEYCINSILDCLDRGVYREIKPVCAQSESSVINNYPIF